MLSSQEIKGIPIQSAQNSMYIFKQLHPETNTYHHTFAMKLKGKLGISILKQALLQLMERHEALNSRFQNVGEQVFQVFDHFKTSTHWPLQIINGKEFTPIPPIEELPKVLRLLNSSDIVEKPFNYEEGPLWRAAVIDFGHDEYQFVMTFDHIIIDVTSQNILLNDLSAIYNSLIEKNSKLGLSDKLKLCDIKKIEEKSAEKIEYWRKTLDSYSPFTLHSDFTAPKTLPFKGDRINFGFTPEDIKNINLFIESYNASLPPKEHKLSLHMLFLASLYVILYRYTGSTDLCVGTASANRRNYNFDEKELAKVVNCFVNSIPLRINLEGNPTFLEILNRVKKMAVEAYQNQIPLNDVIEHAFNTKVDIATPFDIIFVLNEIKTKLDLKEVESSDPIELNLKNTKFQYFGLNLDKRRDGSIDGFIEYNTKLFKLDDFKRFIGHWQTLLKAIQKNPTEYLANLPILTESEKLDLVKFNTTEQKLIQNKFAHELLSSQAQLKPNKIAIVFHNENGEKQTATWKELDTDTDKLAALLMHMGIRKGKMVGISVTRSISMIKAMLAVHKTGGIFVPLETLPSQSLDQKIEILKLQKKNDKTFILVDNQTEDLFIKSKTKTLNLQSDFENQIKLQRHLSYRKPFVSEQDVASIYFTSGSTGNPKGVEVTYSGQRNLLNSLIERKPKPGTKFLCVADIKSDAIWFDISHWIATQGAELHVVNEADRFTPEVLTTIIQREKIDTIVLLPNILAKLDPRELPSLKVVIFEGAPPNKKILEDWMACGIEVHNEWGPTENTVCGSFHICKTGEPTTSIGKPLQNEKIHIVHPIDGSVCPIGIPGEIVVEGAGLAKGYFKNPKLTDIKFPKSIYNSQIPKFTFLSEEKKNLTPLKTLKNTKLPTSTTLLHPSISYMTKQKSRVSLSIKEEKKSKFLSDFRISDLPKNSKITKIYRTGDSGYHDSEGNVIFINRIDNQVKIHGVRIEMDAVINILKTHPNVADVFVTKHSQKETLVAFIVPKTSDKEKFNQDIFEELNFLLGRSAIPSVARLSSVTYLTKLPLKSGGKIDISALPAAYDHEEKITPPTTPLQKKIAELWFQILHSPKNELTKDTIGITSPFSCLGGTSINFTKLINKINSFVPLKQDLVPYHVYEFFKVKQISKNLLDTTIEDLDNIIKLLLIDEKVIDKIQPADEPSSYGFSSLNAPHTIRRWPSSLWATERKEKPASYKEKEEKQDFVLGVR